MSKYAKIPLGKFNLSHKAYRHLSANTKLIYFFLNIDSLTSMSGIFELPSFNRTGLSNSEIKQSLLELVNENLIIIDDYNEKIAVFEIMKINKPAGIKQEKGIIGNYNDIDNFIYWGEVLSYMEEIDYNDNVINYIKESKLGIKPQPIENTEQYEPKDDTDKMLESKQIFDLYVKVTGKKENESGVLDMIYEYLQSNSKVELINAIERYITDLNDIKFSQKPSNFFNSKTGYLQGFIDDKTKGIAKPSIKKTNDIKKNPVIYNVKSKQTIIPSIFDDNKFDKVPDDVMLINSFAIKTIFQNGMEVKFLDYIKSKTEWFTDDNIDIEMSDFIIMLDERIMQADILGNKFLEL